MPEDLEAQQRPQPRAQEEPDPAPVWLMDGTVDVGDGDLDVVICVDEFGPLNLQPHPGRQWALAGGGGPIPRRRATYSRPHGVRHLLPPTTCRGTSCMGISVGASVAASSSASYGTCGGCIHRPSGSRSCWTTTARTCSTTDDPRVGRWAAANNVELAYTPTNASHLQRLPHPAGRSGAASNRSAAAIFERAAWRQIRRLPFPRRISRPGSNR
jgi:hypothetical protein